MYDHHNHSYVLARINRVIEFTLYLYFREITDISILACFLHLRYVVSFIYFISYRNNEKEDHGDTLTAP